MKLSGSVGVGILSLVLGVPAALYAQDEPKQEPKPEPKQEQAKPPKAEQPKPEATHPEANQPEATHPEANQDEMKRPQQDKQEQKEEKNAQKQQEKQPTSGGQEQVEHAQGARPAKGGGRIPDDKFRANFGRSHTVVINRPTVVEGQPRFQYSGYWFVIADPWPADWLYTDQCYIDYVDGEYLLYDLAHPGVTIVLTVVM